MISIEITEETDDVSGMVDALNTIATMVQKGYTSGHNPNWSLSGDYSEECDYCEGLGTRKESEETDSGAGEIVEVECSKCKGEGTITKTV